MSYITCVDDFFWYSWLAEGEITTFSNSTRVLPRTLYLSHQISFHTLVEDYHALILTTRYSSRLFFLRRADRIRYLRQLRQLELTDDPAYVSQRRLQIEAQVISQLDPHTHDDGYRRRKERGSWSDPRRDP